MVSKREFKRKAALSRRQFLKLSAAGGGSLAVSSGLGGILLARSAPVFAQGDSNLVAAVGAEPPSLDPQAIEQRIPQMITWNIYEPLIDRDDQGMTIPWLAESWEQIDDRTTRFKLREGISFHNGEPFNADAAVYSVNRIIDPELASQWIGVVGTIKQATKVNDMAIDIETHDVDPILLGRLTALAMMAPGWTQEVGDEVSSTTNGTGAYKLRNWHRNVQVELESNEDYWGGAPSIKSATLRIIGEDSTRFQSVKTGEIDIYLGPLPDHLPELPKFEAPLAQEFSMVRLSNLEGSTIADPRVRQAMNYAVDKELILQQLHAGLGTVSPGQLSAPGMFGYNPNLEPYPFDLDQAKSLLAEAGAEGLEIDYVAPKGRYAGDAILNQAIAEMLEQAGLKVNLNLLDPQSWVRFGDRNQTPVPPSCWYLVHSNSLFDADRTVSSYYTDESPFSAFHNDEIRTLFEAGRVELDVAEREKIYHRVFELGREDPPAIFLLQLVDLWALTERTQFKPRADGRFIIRTMSL